jgi:hypothetical protein
MIPREIGNDFPLIPQRDAFSPRYWFADSGVCFFLVRSEWASGRAIDLSFLLGDFHPSPRDNVLDGLPLTSDVKPISHPSGQRSFTPQFMQVTGAFSCVIWFFASRNTTFSLIAQLNMPYR